MAYLHQDIVVNRVFSLSTDALLQHFLEEIAPLRHWYINANENSNKYKTSILSQLKYQCLKGALPSRKYSK